LLNRKIKDAKEQGLRHEVDYNLELLKVAGIEVRQSDIQFPIDIKDQDFPGSRMEDSGIENKRFIAIHPWSSNPEKELKPDKFRQLCVRLSREIPYGFGLPAYKIVLIGGKEEAKRSGKFCEGLPVIDLSGKSTLLELSGLFKRSRLLVTVDSGPMHLAAVLGTPVVAIFRKNPPAVSAARWGPVGDKHIIIENDSIENVNLDEVLNGIRKALSG
jgi:ADP-heptose:LPS heptosyltransferase